MINKIGKTLMEESLFEQAQKRVFTEDELISKHSGLVKLYFQYEEQNQNQLILKATREAIEKVENQLTKKQIISK